MKKAFQLIKMVVFCMLMIAAIHCTSGILERKESRVKFGPFWEAKENFDVLFIGNSHMVNGVFPMELWRDYGIVSYNIAGYGNTVPVSYWMMRGAFEKAKPKLLVIDILDVAKHEKINGSSGDLHKVMDSYPFGLNKICAVYDLTDNPNATDDEGNYFVDIRWEYFLPIGKYHARWNVLTQEDFAPEHNKQKGAEAVIGVAQPDEYEILEDSRATEEHSGGFSYLRRMIEECQQQGVEVLLTYLPHPATEKQQRDANAVRWIAEEYGVNFVDLVYLDQVADYGTDMFDSYSHLNPSGAQKVTDYLGKYIREHYDIPDRREDPVYQNWNADYREYVEEKADAINQQYSLHNVLMLLHDRSFQVEIYVQEGSTVYRNETTVNLMHNIVREHVFEEDEFVKYSSAMFPLSGLDEAVYGGEAYFAQLNGPGMPFEEYTGEEAEMLAQACFADSPAGTQVSIRVIDSMTGETVSVRHF